MYLDFDDYRPDIQPIGRAISWREGVLISIIVHLVMVIVLLLAPQLFPFDTEAARQRAAAAAEERKAEAPRFVFVQPRLDMPALRAPARRSAAVLARQFARARGKPRAAAAARPGPKTRSG